MWAKTEKHKTISGISDAIFPARHPRKSSQHAYRGACAAADGAFCSKNRKIVPYYGANPNTKNGVRLRSPSPIMAPGLNFHAFKSPAILNLNHARESTLTKKYTQGRLPYIAHPGVENNIIRSFNFILSLVNSSTLMSSRSYSVFLSISCGALFFGIKSTATANLLLMK